MKVLVFINYILLFHLTCYGLNSRKKLFFRETNTRKIENIWLDSSFEFFCWLFFCDNTLKMIKIIFLLAFKLTVILCNCNITTTNNSCSKEYDNICVLEKSDHTKPDPSNLPMLVQADITIWVRGISDLKWCS